MPGRRLILIRHAKSDYPWGVVDHERPLNTRGRRDAPAIGRWLESNVHWSADSSAPLVLVSSATRTQRTWSLAADQLGPRWSACDVRTEPRIYEAASAELLDLATDAFHENDTVAMVGHNPGLIGLIRQLAVEDDQYELAVAKFPTSAIAVLADEGEQWRVSAFAIARGAES
jgi:phosphohistidine phosphatase